MGQRLVAVLGDHHALAGREPVVLDDVRRAERVEGVGGGLRRAADPGHRGRDAGGGHHLLREGLRALEPGGLRRRAEAGDAPRADGVGDPGDQRRLGADHDEVDAEPLGQVRDRVAVDRVDRVELGDLGDAGVAGGRVDLLDAGVAGERGGERVLAAATADHQDVHEAPVSTIDCSRPGPTPTPQNGVPDISSSART